MCGEKQTHLNQGVRQPNAVWPHEVDIIVVANILVIIVSYNFIAETHRVLPANSSTGSVCTKLPLRTQLSRRATALSARSCMLGDESYSDTLDCTNTHWQHEALLRTRRGEAILAPPLSSPKSSCSLLRKSSELLR